MTALEQELLQITDMTQLEQKLCNIYVLADKIVHEPTVGIWPQAVSQSQVAKYACVIRECVLDAMEHLDHPSSPGSLQ